MGKRSLVLLGSGLVLLATLVVGAYALITPPDDSHELTESLNEQAAMREAVAVLDYIQSSEWDEYVEASTNENPNADDLRAGLISQGRSQASHLVEVARSKDRPQSERLLAIEVLAEITPQLDATGLIDQGLGAAYDLRDAIGKPSLGDPAVTAILRRYVELAPINANVKQLYADELLAMGQVEAALEQTVEATDLDPTLTNAWYLRGLTERQLGDNEAAIRSFERTLEIAPEYKDVYQAKAVTLRLLGRFAEALEAVERAAEIGELSPAFQSFREQLVAQLATKPG